MNEDDHVLSDEEWDALVRHAEAMLNGEDGYRPVVTVPVDGELL